MPPEGLEELARAARKRPIFEPSATTQTVDLGRSAIEGLVPHRDPFLFVDRIRAIDLEVGTCVGERVISTSDPVFRGHFPDHPVYPGVLLLETMGQLACCLASLMRGGRADVRALKIHNATFQTEVRPGASLTILARMLELDDWGAVCAGQILDGPAVATFSVSEVHFVEA